MNQSFQNTIRRSRPVFLPRQHFQVSILSWFRKNTDRTLVPFSPEISLQSADLPSFFVPHSPQYVCTARQSHGLWAVPFFCPIQQPSHADWLFLSPLYLQKSLRHFALPFAPRIAVSAIFRWHHVPPIRALEKAA